MTLQELGENAEIQLEIIHRERKFDIPLKTVGVDPKGILIPTFAYAGRTIDFSG